jgi:hypothetical protein
MNDDVTRLRYLLRGVMRLGAVVCAAILVWRVGIHTIEVHHTAQVEIARARTFNQAIADMAARNPNAKPGPIRTVPSYASLMRRCWLLRVDDWQYPWPTMVPWLVGAVGLWVLQKRFPRFVFMARPPGSCSNCNYDLGAKPPPRCPECGVPTGSQPRAPHGDGTD